MTDDARKRSRERAISAELSSLTNYARAIGLNGDITYHDTDESEPFWGVYRIDGAKLGVFHAEAKEALMWKAYVKRETSRQEDQRRRLETETYLGAWLRLLREEATDDR